MKRLLIVGCGDVAMRAIPLLRPNYHLYALIRNPAHAVGLRALGVTPMLGNLDVRGSLARLAGIASTVLHLAPPPNSGLHDTRTQHLLAALSFSTLPTRLLYISTSGVYGDCAGARVGETTALAAHNPRALRRVDAEQQVRTWAANNGVHANILRVPGIYAHDRLPLDRLRAGAPAILASEDSYSNHIHADDLARIMVATLRYGKANRVYHATDDDEMKMGDYFDAVAEAHRLPCPPRLPRIQVQAQVSAMMWSFMSESRRLTNKRMKQELKVRLLYPTVATTLASI